MEEAIRHKLARIGTEATPTDTPISKVVPHAAECEQGPLPSCSHVLEPKDARILKIGRNSTLVRLDQIGAGGDPTQEITTLTRIMPTFYDYPSQPPNDRFDFTITLNRARHWIDNDRTLGVLRDPPVSHSFSIPHRTFYSKDDCRRTMEREIRFGNLLPPYIFPTLIGTLVHWACVFIKLEVIQRAAWPRCFRLDLDFSIDTKVIYQHQHHRGTKRKAPDC